MRILSIVLSILALSVSCVSLKKFNGYVQSGYSNDTAKTSTLTRNYITVETSKIKEKDSLVNIEKVKNTFIPAIFYWSWESNFRCEINPKRQAEKIKSNIILYADTVMLEQKLHGQRIELSIESVPHAFSYLKKGSTIFLLIYYIGQGEEIITPVKQNIKVSYKLFSDKDVTKNGKVDIKFPMEIKSNLYDSTRDFTLIYIEEYEKLLKKLSKSVVDKILAEVY